LKGDSKKIVSGYKVLPTRRQRLTGVLIIVLVPLGFAIWTGLYFSLAQVRQDGAVLLIAVLFYVVFLVSEVVYDTPRISRIDMKSINPDVVNLVTKTTSKGDRVYVILLRAFAGTKLSQTKLFKKAGENGIDLTQPAVRQYIKDLEDYGLISSPQTKYAKEYELTEWGKWCRHVVNQLLPSRTFLYVLRDYLGYRSIPPEPSHSESSTVEGAG